MSEEAAGLDGAIVQMHSWSHDRDHILSVSVAT